MEITTFGAIMKFAMERENALYSLLEEIKGSNKLSQYRDLVEQASSDCKKNLKTIERTRRENINEMILQPISGLSAGNYLVQQRETASMSDVMLGEYLENLISSIERFYRDAAGELPNGEAIRTFQRLAKKKQGVLDKIATGHG